MQHTVEYQRLIDASARKVNWKRWGPYLSERQWATVREDYSAQGKSWDFFPHDHARSRAYRWGEDGLLGITDRECRLCFALALWNQKDPILKERLFGLTGPEGNHGEDVKECYFYLDSSPSHSYMKALYKYPQAAYPYDRIVAENKRRGLAAPEYELMETGVFAEDRYFDVQAEYAKGGPDDLLIRVTLFNRGPDEAPLHFLPTLWFRNTWSWGAIGENIGFKPRLSLRAPGCVEAEHATLGRFVFECEPGPEILFTENETNEHRLFGVPNAGPYTKDAFDNYLVHGVKEAVNPAMTGTKCTPHFALRIGGGQSRTLRFRLRPSEAAGTPAFGPGFEEVFTLRLRESDEFYDRVIPASLSPEEKNVSRQGYAGLLWTKQFYNYVVEDWLAGDPGTPRPPEERLAGRNHDWKHLYSRDIISMPDKWEYPWFAAWDLAFHMVPFSRIDPFFAKFQLSLLLREWYMHPNGQIPAYEFGFSDVNPPVHAWAAWRVYKMTGLRGERDRSFLESTFQKLLLNFTWWVNRKDPAGHNLFSGGFLGLDNIGVFDRSSPLPGGGHLNQADGTAWMAFYSLTMLSIALELARENPVYEDMASKFFEHFIRISDAMNEFGGTGLWDEEDGFYYDQLSHHGESTPIKTRSLVGLLPLIAVEVLEEEEIRKLPGFYKRLQWFVENRRDLANQITYCNTCAHDQHRLLAIPTQNRLERVLRYLLDEQEFLSPFGIRSLSKAHEARPYQFRHGGTSFHVDYIPGESNSLLFGGNSNWRGPIWFPTCFLLIEALQRYHHFYGNGLQVEFPTGSDRRLNLGEVARELSCRMTRLFLPGPEGTRPFQSGDPIDWKNPAWKDLVLFHEYYHAESGRGLGAGHQTGWTALAVKLLEMAHAHVEYTPEA